MRSLDPTFINHVDDDGYCFEWFCGSRKLTIYSSKAELYGFKVDHSNPCGGVEDVDDELESLHAAWEWLTEKECY